MKNLLIPLTILSIFLSTMVYGKTYYVSANGNDNNNGLSASAPWKTLNKVNASFTSIPIVAGDQILFRRGDRFDGQLWVRKNGTAALPIVIGAYGSGELRPVFTGFTTITGWTKVAGNIWQATPAKALKKNCNILTINGIPQHVGRTGWMTYSAATTTTLTSSSLSGTSYVGAEFVIRKNVFVAEKLTCTAQSGSVVTLVNNTQPIDNGLSASPQPGKSGNGFFIQRFAGSMDTQGEWYFNAGTNKMQLYSTTNPSNFVIKASYVDTVIKLHGATNIRISDIAVEGGGLYGIESYGANNIVIKNCEFNNNTKAVYVWNTDDIVVEGNKFENSFNGAILISNNQRKRISVSNNYVHNTGQLMGMGVFNKEYSLRGIVARTSEIASENFVNITGNTVITSGNAAIQFQGSNVVVERNITDSFCNVIDDNGGIYTFVANANLNTTRYTNRRIANNFISNAIGAPLGSAGGHIDVAGLYLDDQAGDIICENNTIENIPGNGIQFNNPIRDTLINNTVYNSTIAINVNVKQYGPVTGNVIKHNNFYPYTDAQFVARYTNTGLNNTGQTIGQALKSFALMDSNFVRMKKSAGFDYYYAATQGGSYTFPSPMTIATWRNTSGHDIRSLEAAPTKAVILRKNTTGELATFNFSGLSKHDPKLRIYNNSVVLPIWNSLLLLDNGSSAPPAANVAPEASAGVDTTIVLPGGMIYLRGSGADTDGTISIYSWELISTTPVAGKITRPREAVTPVTGLVQGTYQYRLTVTDNKGATGVSTVAVKVLPDIQPENFLVLYGTKLMN